MKKRWVSPFSAGQDRTGQDRTGQDRTGQDRIAQHSKAHHFYSGLSYEHGLFKTYYGDKVM